MRCFCIAKIKANPGSIAAVPSAARGPHMPMAKMLSRTGRVRNETDRNSDMRNSVHEKIKQSIPVAANPPRIMGTAIRVMN